MTRFHKRAKEPSAEQLAFANRIRDCRTNLGMTQAELARKAGITQPTESRIEHADIGDIKSPTLLRLANALGVTTDFLLGKPASSEVGAINQHSGNAEYLFGISHDLNRQQTLHLIRFAEFMTFIDSGPVDFLKMFRELYDICAAAAKTDSEIAKSSAFEKAGEFLANEAVARAIRIEEEMEKKRQNGS